MNPQKNFWPGVFAIVLGTFMAVLDTSIVNVAIPEMMSVFGVSADEIQWVITAYTLAMAAIIPLSGYASTRFGLKKSYLASLFLFTLGSCFCGFAWSSGTMVASRIIQAVGGGLMMTIGQSMIQYVVPREKIGPAMGVFGISVFVAPAIGPVLSGYFVQYLDWRLIFTVNIPFGLLAMLLVWHFLQESEPKKDHPFDLFGFLFSAVMLVALLLACTKGEEWGWDSFPIVSLFLTALAAGVLFVVWELSTEHPLVDVRLFLIRDFSLGLLVNSLLMAGNFGLIYLLPIYSENMLGHSAMETGLLLLPQAIASGVITPLCGFLAFKTGLKPLIFTGILFCAISGLWIAAVDLNTDYTHLQWLLTLRGIGLGLCLMTSMQIPLICISDQNRVPAASVITNVCRQVATSVGIAALISLFSHRSVQHAAHLAESVTATGPIHTEVIRQWEQLFLSQGFSAQDAAILAVQMVSQLVKKYASIHALQDSLLAVAVVLFAALGATLLVKERKLAPGSRYEQTMPAE
ncbi:DHA2 family efflux MFS transporter permease subunit [Brevibacillus massiliensis]|jgi:DHA2 family multidrug resistance protein|uniref:DHA2 family efflux MFS transporter permease subunit n=1 Tax=Brevibacillus massiliensis TaxID=1118054 RepID=UPI00030F0105|nr:DHA2 family efflux MFS transporter permease subunit [Brevibacillus massiliensis]